MAAAVSAPAAEAGPERKPPAASKGAEDAKQLAAEAKRLADLGKYDEALPLAERAVALSVDFASRLTS